MFIQILCRTKFIVVKNMIMIENIGNQLKNVKLYKIAN